MTIDNDFINIGSAPIHSGSKDNANQAHLVPIYATSTFTFDNAEQGTNRFLGDEQGFIYSRFGNPTTAAAAETIAQLEAFSLNDEQGKPLQLSAILHASGQAAMVTMFLSNLSAGDSVLSHHSLYGGTHEFLFNLLPKFGISSSIANLSDLKSLPVVIRNSPSLKMIHIETPANPTMRCIDIQAVTQIAKKYGLLVTVDNTFATPYLQQPFRYGVDFVFHSTTKFLNGHGTSIGGVLVGKDLDFMKSTGSRFHQLLGATSSPFDAYLLLQGVKTLAVRMEKHCSNAAIVASFLARHQGVVNVNYNGLPDNESYDISMRQMRYPGAVLSFDVRNGVEGGRRFIDRLSMCTRAVSVGTVDTLVSHPASMSHSGMTPEARHAAGISDGLIRMSVGLEDPDDILRDLDRAIP